MAEFCATSAANPSRLPEVSDSIGRWLDDFERLGSAERTTAIFKDSDLDYLTGEDVRDEQNAPLMSGNEDATVRDLLNGRFDFAA